MTGTITRRLLAACLAAAFLAAGLAAMSGCGEKREAYSPSPAQRFDPMVNAGSTVVLSSDQERLISKYGYPSHFFISMDQVTGDRIETWTYFPLKESYTFHQGRQVRKEAALDQSERYPPTTLRPEDFGPDLSLTEAEGLLGKPYEDAEFTGAGGESVIILFYDEAVLDYTDGRLTGVETMVSSLGSFPEVDFP